MKRGCPISAIASGPAVCRKFRPVRFSSKCVRSIVVPFRPKLYLRKGVAHTPNDATIDEAASRSLLTSIARSRRWVDDLLSGVAADFCEIAAREKLVEWHVRFLIPLAYLSPRIVTAIAERRCPLT